MFFKPRPTLAALPLTRKNLTLMRNSLLTRFKDEPSITAGFLIRLLEDPKLTRQFYQDNADPNKPLALNEQMKTLLSHVTGNEAKDAIAKATDRQEGRRNFLKAAYFGLLTSGATVTAAEMGIGEYKQNKADKLYPDAYKKSDSGVIVAARSQSVDEQVLRQTAEEHFDVGAGALLITTLLAFSELAETYIRPDKALDAENQIYLKSLEGTARMHHEDARIALMKSMNAITPAIEAEHARLHNNPQKKLGRGF